MPSLFPGGYGVGLSFGWPLFFIKPFTVLGHKKRHDSFHDKSYKLFYILYKYFILL